LVPASPRNNAIFQHWYESDVVPTIDQNLRRDAFIEIETMPFRVGKIQLNEAVIKDGQVVSYSLNFFGALTSLKDRFGEDILANLDYSSIGFTYTGTQVYNRLTDGTTSYDIRFPLVSPTRLWSDVAGVDNIFNASTPLSYLELFPAVRVPKIFDFIEAKYGITFNSTFFSSTRWTDLYFRHQINNKPNLLTNKHLCGYANNTGVDFVTFNSATSEVLILEFLEIDITINLAAVSSTTAKFFVEVFRNDTLYSTTEIAPTLTGIAIKKVASTPIQAYEAETVPYKIFLYADEPVTCNASITFDQGLAGTFTKNVVSPIVLTSTVATALNSTMKVADFVSVIFKAFNLVCVGENETTFTIEPLQDWYNLGGEKDISVNVRVLAATNKDLQKEIEKGLFRMDLYHRLNVINIVVPPLNERRDDIPVLAMNFLKQICDEYKMKSPAVDDDALEELKKHNWTGNIRELRNVMERLIILSEKIITKADIEKFVIT
jgi:hypothetical protein